MTALERVIKALIADGMSPVEAASTAALAGAELHTAGPSKAAARTRKWRANKASQTVTERHAVTVPDLQPGASPNVTNRHGDVTGDGAHISSSTSLDLNKESPKEEKKIEVPKSKRPSRIPDGWQLDQKHIDHAISKGIAPERIQVLGEKFKNHFLGASGKGSTSPDWFRKWCNWCLNDVEWNGKSNGQQSNGHRTAQTTRSGATGQDAILAGMGRLADRVRARGDAERRDREASADDGPAQGPDARLL